MRFPLLVTLAVALVACGEPPGDSADAQVRERLVGTWLRDYEQEGARVRRVLVLEPDGHFEEQATVSEPGAPPAQHAHEGEWHFDGTNLKRRYTRFDGQQPSAPTLPYATFQIRFRSKNEFVGRDNVRRREVVYERVPDGTLP